MNFVNALGSMFGYRLLRKSRQPSLEDHLAELLRLKRFDHVIDVGAHKGGYPKSLRALGYRGEIISFEPSHISYSRLREASVSDSRWQVHQIGIGDAEGWLPLQDHPRADMSSFLELSPLGVASFGQSTGNRTPVEIKRGDAIWESLIDTASRKCLLKTDTQGYDLKVLTGFGSRLDQVSVVQVEAPFIHLYKGAAGWMDIYSYLECRGFLLSGIYPVSRTPETAIIEADMVFIRRC